MRSLRILFLVKSPREKRQLQREKMFNFRRVSSSICHGRMFFSSEATIKGFESKATLALQDYLNEQLNVMRNEGTFKQERIIKSPQGSQIICENPLATNVEKSDDSRQVGQREVSMLNLCANNYLGWSNLPGKPHDIYFTREFNFLSCFRY